MFGPYNNEIQKLTDHMKAHFKLKTSSQAKFYVGLEVKRGDGYLEIHSETFILQLARRIGLADANPAKNLAPAPGFVDGDDSTVLREADKLTFQAVLD